MLSNTFYQNFFFFSEEFFVIILIFSFLNYIFSVLFLELLWPTHLFNFRSSTSLKKLNLNSYQSVLLKSNSYTFKSPSKFFIKYLT